MLIVIIPGRKCKNLKILSLESKAAIACCGQSSQVFKRMFEKSNLLLALANIIRGYTDKTQRPGLENP
jgi:hypothetical protein